MADTTPSVSTSSFTVFPPSVAHFQFPALLETPKRPAAPKTPQIMWPECAQAIAAYSEMAIGILRQWSSSANEPTFSLDRHTVLALTSPGDGDGKTSLLLHLAPRLAERIANEILVVDANFRGSNLTTRLPVCDDKATKKTLIYPTDLPMLNVLPSPSTSRPMTISSSLIEELRETWPLVVLDMPSLAQSNVASLTAACDGVYLVTRLGYTSRRSIAKAAKLLRSSGSRLLGCLVIK
jgi:Mrp family chromosome partitioning ATPase